MDLTSKENGFTIFSWYEKKYAAFITAITDHKRVSGLRLGQMVRERVT